MYRGKVHNLDALLVHFTVNGRAVKMNNKYLQFHAFGRCFIQIKSVFNVYIFEFPWRWIYVLCVLPLELVLFLIFNSVRWCTYKPYVLYVSFEVLKFMTDFDQIFAFHQLLCLLVAQVNDIRCVRFACTTNVTTNRSSAGDIGINCV